MPTDNDNSSPRVLIISLHYQDVFEESCGRLLAQLRSKATVQLVKDPVLAIQVLESRPSAILITDEALTLKENALVWDAVLRCVREGCTALLMGQFSSFVQPNKIQPLVAKAGLSWEPGAYNRTTVVVNRAATGDELAQKLPTSYSQKALFLQNVAPSDAWYTTDEDSVIESHVFYPDSAHRPGQSPVAMARVGHGNLGYTGDVNSEQGTDAVVLAMCGLI
ncbi:hypothetical protein N7462_000298 [Penicillium macrosclerotiorum]|uniref:uncharacterized protein n=1 Tax=Penicillium macrosclerotiorum TaxID=303699 RepID=UPI002549849D|nr:uncharacterized protein N7462_000298 [Penicillium macrosclerotiorum]KAJ5698293.1 hypothetical protein N7462_000298 [Penicillium macrosclerotiorum]